MTTKSSTKDIYEPKTVKFVGLIVAIILIALAVILHLLSS